MIVFCTVVCEHVLFVDTSKAPSLDQVIKVLNEQLRFMQLEIRKVVAEHGALLLLCCLPANLSRVLQMAKCILLW